MCWEVQAAPIVGDVYGERRCIQLLFVVVKGVCWRNACWPVRCWKDVCWSVRNVSQTGLFCCVAEPCLVEVRTVAYKELL